MLLTHLALMESIIQGQLQDSYEQLSFSGGGVRCFWQGGALDALRSTHELAPERIACTSGGALAGACFIADRGSKLVDVFCAQLDHQDQNLEIGAGQSPTEVTPHQQIYRMVVEEVIDREAEQAVADGPAFEVLLAHPPGWLPIKFGAAVTMFMYEVDKKLRSTPHGKFASAVGAHEMRVDARGAARKGKLKDLVCQAATIPPVFSMRKWDGNLVIDAGTIDNAPMPNPNAGRTLVLLTRDYRNLPNVDGRTYLKPSSATPADKIDFTDPDALRATYHQGRKDIEALLSE